MAEGLYFELRVIMSKKKEAYYVCTGQKRITLTIIVSFAKLYFSRRLSKFCFDMIVFRTNWAVELSMGFLPGCTIAVLVLINGFYFPSFLWERFEVLRFF